MDLHPHYCQGRFTDAWSLRHGLDRPCRVRRIAAGTWSRSNSSVATALAPYLEDGSVLVLGESAPEEFERGIGRVPSLQRLFDRVQILEADAEHTRKILAAVRDEEKLPITDHVL